MGYVQDQTRAMRLSLPPPCGLPAWSGVSLGTSLHGGKLRGGAVYGRPWSGGEHRCDGDEPRRGVKVVAKRLTTGTGPVAI